MKRAKLIDGKDYRVDGITFRFGVPVTVTNELGAYLRTLPNFRVTEAPSPTPVAPAARNDAPYEPDPFEPDDAADATTEEAGPAAPTKRRGRRKGAAKE